MVEIETTIHIGTDNSGQANSLDLLQLMWFERTRVDLRSILVVEPIPILEASELLRDEMPEGFPNKTVLGPGLNYKRSHEKIDIIRTLVDLSQLNASLTEFVKALDLGQACPGTVIVVRSKGVIATSLDVERRQIRSERVLSGKQEPGEAQRDGRIDLLLRLGTERKQIIVEAGRSQHSGRIVKGSVERDRFGGGVTVLDAVI